MLTQPSKTSRQSIHLSRRHFGMAAAGLFLASQQQPIRAEKASTADSPLFKISLVIRLARAGTREVVHQDYIKFARAKGLSSWQTIWAHALRNALIPVLTIIGLQFSFLLAGAIIIEQVFYLPGLGRLVFQAITQRDLIVVESVVMLLVFAVILVNFIVDIAYMLVDPRLRQDSI